MNSMPSYRDFAVTDATSRLSRTLPPRRGLMRRVLDAIALSHQRAAEREIGRMLGGDRLTDEGERRLFERLTSSRSFYP